MQRLTRVLAAVTLAGLTLFVRPPGAQACSCAPLPDGQPHPQTIVVGTAGTETDHGTWDKAWQFGVESVERGDPRPGDEIALRITRGGEASCGVDVPRPEPGRRYRAGGLFDVPNGTLHLNLCSGALLEPAGEAGPSTTAVVRDIKLAPTTSSTQIVDPPTSTQVTDPTLSTPSTLLAVLDGADDSSGGIDGRVVVTGVGAAAGAGAGAVGLRRFWKARSLVG